MTTRSSGASPSLTHGLDDLLRLHTMTYALYLNTHDVECVFYNTVTPCTHLAVIRLQLIRFITISCCLPTSSVHGVMQGNAPKTTNKGLCINVACISIEHIILCFYGMKSLLSMWCKQTQESPLNEDKPVFNRRSSFYHGMNKNKVSVTALFRTLRSHCRAEQNLNVSASFQTWRSL